MKRNLSKFITIAIVLIISVINPIDAFAYLVHLSTRLVHHLL